MSPELLSMMLIEAVPSYSISASDVWGMVINSGFVIKIVMLLLLGFSVVSWAIIIFKFNQLKRARGQSYDFLELFWKSRGLSNIYSSASAFTASPVAHIFRVGYQELGRVRKNQAESSPMQLQGLDNVKRALRRTAGAESTRLSKALTFL
ncbi:MAG: flagellar motor protein MotA, partial [Thermodesulfobacteriota bacterium]|nr:flagellar motor protein MotA [Thermodesulfobacteriota bacterium]